MAYREIGMWEIHEVLRRVARGERQRGIERVTGHSRSDLDLTPVFRAAATPLEFHVARERFVWIGFFGLAAASGRFESNAFKTPTVLSS